MTNSLWRKSVGRKRQLISYGSVFFAFGFFSFGRRVVSRVAYAAFFTFLSDSSSTVAYRRNFNPLTWLRSRQNAHLHSLRLMFDVINISKYVQIERRHRQITIVISRTAWRSYKLFIIAVSIIFYQLQRSDRKDSRCH